MSDAAARSTRRGRWGLVAAFVVGQAMTLALLLGPLWGLPWWQGFRRYFANDQLSYAAIASNVSIGQIGLVEPFTLTGSLYYPSLWYQLIGLAVRVTGLPVYLMWTLMGLAIVALAVGTAGWLAYRFSSRPYAPLLPALALYTGTFSVRTVDYWYTPLSNHAVLWGPFGTLFTLNAEVAGLALATVAICLLLLASRLSAGSRPALRIRLILGAAAIIGLLANVQTYSFITAVSLTALFLSGRSLLQLRSRGLAAITIVLLASVLLLGPVVSRVTGPLPVFGLLLLALMPSVVPLARRQPRLALAAVVVTAVCAAPQVLRTLAGLAAGDPFLTYRQASTQGLSVPLGQGFLAALPLLLVAALCAVALWRRRQVTLTALLIALGAGTVIMASNDRWGFNQEPYRFWLQYAVVGSLLLSVVLAWSLAQVGSMASLRRGFFVLVGMITVVVWAVSVTDIPQFWKYARDQGVISAQDDRADAIRDLLAPHEGLVLSSVCLDPGVLKLISPGPVAYYNAGLAWPADELAFKTFQDVEGRAGQNPAALKVAGVRYVMTDSACATDWQFPADQSVVPARTRDYDWDGQPETLTLWWVQPTRPA